MAGEHLDLSSDPPISKPLAATGSAGRSCTGQGGRPFVGMHFLCCDIYTRIYLNREGTKYLGNCPRCARRAELLVGPGGSDSRFFTAT
jgi:hypothetical protein